jgi:hypothetical protein
MPNARRGEVGVTLAGERYTLCLTLGALAEIEEALGAPDLAALGERFAGGRLRSRDLVALLGAALRGGGHRIADAEVAALPLEGGLDALGGALARALALAFGEEPATRAAAEGASLENPPPGVAPSPGTTP